MSSRSKQSFIITFNASTRAPPREAATDANAPDALPNIEGAFAKAHRLYEKGRRGENTRELDSCRLASDDESPVYLRDFYFDQKQIWKWQSADSILQLLNVPDLEYESEVEGHRGWLDEYWWGFENGMEVDTGPYMDIAQTEARAKEYGISEQHMEFYEECAELLGIPLGTFMKQPQETARRIGIKLE
ncbi:hypothetical protein OQA88_870 [Cercophora sp. LCS_1]